MREYECALTGKVVEVEDEEGFPIGWTKITITRRQMNPRWALLMQVQNAMIEGAMSQVPAEIADLQRIVITTQVEAQFHALVKDTPAHVNDVEDEIYICDSDEVMDSMTELREMLGLRALPAVEKQNQDQDDEDADEGKSESKEE